MPVEVEFFYGVASRYSYLAATQLAAIEHSTGCRFRWRPLFSGDLLAMRGASPFDGRPLSGQYDWSYHKRDAEEWAAYYGVSFREPPPSLKQAELPKRLALGCVAAAGLDAVKAYSTRLFQAVFVDANPGFDDADLSAYAEAVGIDGDHFSRMLNSRATVAALDATTQEAFRRGAFGVPTFFVGDRMYWGNDRLSLLVRFLETRSS